MLFGGQNIAFGNPLHSFRSEHCIWKPSAQFQVRTLYLETLFTVSGQNIAFGNSMHSFRSEYCIWKPSAQFQVRILHLETLCTKISKICSKLKINILIHTRSDKTFKDTVLNYAQPSLHGGSLEITLDSPFKDGRGLQIFTLILIIFLEKYQD